jgi:predicted nuclease with TOPRIM domain
MENNDVSLLVELLRRTDENLSRLESRLEKIDLFMPESARDRTILKEQVRELQVKVEHISDLLSGSKKKGGIVIAGAFISALIGAGAIDWPKLLKSILGQH